MLKRKEKTKAKRVMRDVPPKTEDDYDLRKFYTRIQARAQPASAPPDGGAHVSVVAGCRCQPADFSRTRASNASRRRS